MSPTQSQRREGASNGVAGAEPNGGSLEAKAAPPKALFRQLAANAALAASLLSPTDTKPQTQAAPPAKVRGLDGDAIAQAPSETRGLLAPAAGVRKVDEYKVSFRGRTPEAVAQDVKSFLSKHLPSVGVSLQGENAIRARGIDISGEEKGAEFEFKVDGVDDKFRGVLSEGAAVAVYRLPNEKNVLTMNFNSDVYIKKEDLDGKTVLMPAGKNVDVFLGSKEMNTTILTRYIRMDGKGEDARAILYDPRIRDDAGTVDAATAVMIGEEVVRGAEAVREINRMEAGNPGLSTAISAFRPSRPAVRLNVRPILQGDHPGTDRREPERAMAGASASAPHVPVDALNRLESLVAKLNRRPPEITFPDTPSAKAFQAQLDRLQREVPAVAKYLDGKAGVGPTGIAEVNRFLTDRGFSIKIDPNQNQVGVASVLKVGGNWIFQPKPTTVNVVGAGGTSTEQAAVRFKDGVSFHSVDGHDGPVVKLPLVGGQALYVTKVGEGSPFTRQGSALAQYCAGLSLEDGSPQYSKYAGVVVPMASLEERGIIDGLLGVKVGDFVITQALQQTKFTLDEKGAVGESGVALGASRGLDFREPYEINGPYAVYFKTPSGVVPFAAVISPEHMLAPREEGARR